MQQILRSFFKQVDLVVLLFSLSAVYVVWRIALTYIGGTPTLQLNIYLGVGVLFSFVIYTAVYALSSANHRGELIVKNMTAELRDKNKFFEAVLASLPIGIAVNAVDSGKATFVNTRFEEIYGWKKEEIASVDVFFEKVYPDPKVRESIRARIMADIGSGDPARMRWDEVEITTGTGEKRYVDARNIPLSEQNLMVSTVIDVSERKKITDAHKKHLSEIESLNKLMVGRELKMVELKKQIALLKKGAK